MKAVKVAVLAAQWDMLATPSIMWTTLCGVLAAQDTHGNSRGLEGPFGGGILYMKNFYGLELLNNHF